MKVKDGCDHFRLTDEYWKWIPSCGKHYDGICFIRNIAAPAHPL